MSRGLGDVYKRQERGLALLDRDRAAGDRHVEDRGPARGGGVVPAAGLAIAQVVTTLLFAAALFGLGSGVRVGVLLRNGRRGLALGAVSTVLVALVGFGALAVAGGF